MFKLKNLLIITGLSLILIGCAGSNNSRISKVNEVDYPEGISVIIHNKDLRDDLKIISSRLVNAKYKKQVQLVIDNTSSDNYNIIIGHEWTDSRGVVINNHMLKNRSLLNAESSKRVILNAPSFKAKDVLINISCGTPCIKE